MRPASPKHLREGGLFGVALVTRATYLFIYQPTLDSYYFGIAESLLRTGVLGFDGRLLTAFEPGYPFFLAAARLIFGERIVLIQLLQVALAAVGAVLLYYLALELSSSRRVATMAGLLFALHPLLIRQASAASDLAMATTLLVGCALAFVRIRAARSAAIAGVMLGITVLTRSMVLPVLMFGTVLLLATRQRRAALVFALTAIVTIAPLAVRNYVRSGVPWPGRNGLALYVGNSPHTAALLPTYDLDLLEPEAHERFVRARPDVPPDTLQFDVEFDAFLTRQAVAHITEHPWRTVREKIKHVAYLLSPQVTPIEISGRDTRVVIERGMVIGVEGSVPRPRIEVVAHAVITSFLLAGCAAGVYIRRRELRRDAILWAIFVTFLIVNAMYVPATRYTAPIQFVLIFYSAVACARLREGFRHASVA